MPSYALSRRLVTTWTKVVVFDMMNEKNANHAFFWNFYFYLSNLKNIRIHLKIL